MENAERANALETLPVAPNVEAIELPAPEPQIEVAPISETSNTSTNSQIGRAVLREIVETIALFAVIFTIARVTIGNFIIIGQSMEPNYHEQQRLLVDRISPSLGWLQRGDVDYFAFTRRAD